jgi:flagellar basal body rod protein FlgG
MVKLISAQRAFQSAAEVLKKQDEILQNINNISR